MKHDPEQCSSCRYWLPSKDDPEVGSCRCSHPMVVGDYKNTQTIFPQTKPTTWCGEYARGATVNLPVVDLSNEEQVRLPGAFIEVPNPAPPEPSPEPTAIVGRDAPIPEPEAPIPPMPEVDVQKPTAKKK